MKPEKLNINQWDESDRPREKFMQKSPCCLTNSELLAILIGSGTRTETAVDLMKRILSDCNNSLEQLGRLTIEELTRYNGIGIAKAVTIAAACELGKRRQAEYKKESHTIECAYDIYETIAPIYQDMDREEVWLIMMHNNTVIRQKMMFRGSATEATFDIKPIMKETLISGANVICITHNHISGDPEPSYEDNLVTEKLKNACSQLDISLFDHVIIGRQSFYSYAEHGFID